MTREAHAHLLRQDAAKAISALLLAAWEAGRLNLIKDADEDAAKVEALARLDALARFAGMDDDEAELEFDGAPDTREQVTTPEQVWA